MTEKQRQFCLEYLVDLNATQAAIRAGYSEKTANEQGARLLANASIQAEVSRMMKERAERTGITADRVLQEIAGIAFSSVGDYLTFGPGGVRLKDSKDLTPEQLARVAEVSHQDTEAGRNVKFKLYDKLAALEKLARHLGLFEADNKQSAPLVIKAKWSE